MNLTALRAHPASPGRNPAVLLTGLAVVTALCYAGWQMNADFAEENNVMEWGQALFLLLACVVQGTRTLRYGRDTLGFVIHAGLTLLMYSFLVRELDMREWDDAGSHAWRWVEHVARFIGWSLWVVMLGLVALRAGRLLRAARRIAALPVLWYVALAGVLMVSGWPFDKEAFSGLAHDTSRFIEEALELNAYILLFCAALADSWPEDAGHPLFPVSKG
jgi:hypothetical protein